ncbi:peptidylprolyl isomerase [Alteriqipengyuania sp. WL0013]|uniref:peptidylprolyl isomerase n=1 Tax=Alteriqipengyuania sp. WL0013 TaxID=3110773 RepID=UPI002CC760A7|nr:peptidylprolyl isomerase [Alteriqipengyuania sp. WL0013]MEB3416919.1 peptidylprolyl isomerase [Alteriqipengyuania sp. WL0013]
MRALLATAAALALALPAAAQDEAPLSPGEIVAQADAAEWQAIAAEDLVVMTLAPDRDGKPREVVIQLMPEPFSQGWIANIRTLARSGWYDGTSVNRVQDNYVVQWGDPNYDNPEADGEANPLPEGLRVMAEEDFTFEPEDFSDTLLPLKSYDVTGSQRMAAARQLFDPAEQAVLAGELDASELEAIMDVARYLRGDSFALNTRIVSGWPFATGLNEAGSGELWPVHCYGMVGVGRNYSPDTGSGAELYTVIGHAPRHLDRNIALVGRVIEGIEHLSSLPRGTGALGFYETAEERVPILQVRVASDLPVSEQPLFEYLSTVSESFAAYAEARANRRDPFFIVPAGGADICNIPVPVRRVQP